MLPLAHIYVSTKVTGQVKPLLVLGSIIPDIATTSAQQIGRDKIHNSPAKISDFINTNYPLLNDLALGMRLHSNIGGGADFYCDDPKIGYAKIEGAKISADVAKLLNIQDGDISLVLAHNFIEMAIDLHLFKNQREIWDIYSKALKDVEKDLPLISKCLGEYLELDPNMVLKEIENFINIWQPMNFTSKELAIRHTVIPLIKLRFYKEVSEEETLKIVEKALIITEPTYKTFLDNTVVEVAKNVIS